MAYYVLSPRYDVHIFYANSSKNCILYAIWCGDPASNCVATYIIYFIHLNRVLPYSNRAISKYTCGGKGIYLKDTRWWDSPKPPPSWVTSRHHHRFTAIIYIFIYLSIYKNRTNSRTITDGTRFLKAFKPKSCSKSHPHIHIHTQYAHTHCTYASTAKSLVAGDGGGA